jgi:hypothetical protein
MQDETNLWVKELLKNLDEHVAEPIRKKVLDACGRNCPFTHLPDRQLLEMKIRSSSDADFLNALSREWYLKREGGDYFVVFDRCYCPLVDRNTQGASPTLCFCTLGNIKRKLSIGLGRDVDVDMQKTILAGDEECRFLIGL